VSTDLDHPSLLSNDWKPPGELRLQGRFFVGRIELRQVQLGLFGSSSGLDHDLQNSGGEK